jgi:transcriptional regulator GlxA family with amidase domain
MRICIIAVNDVFDTGLATLIDAFTTANELAEVTALTSLRFDVSIVGVRKSVKTAQGLAVPVRAPTRTAPECVIVPAIGFKMPNTLEPSLARPEIKDATLLLQRWARGGATMASACVGTFIMAEAGLLDHHESTTTWWLAPFFRGRYPNVRLDETRMLIKSGSVVTAGAALGHMDLALWLIRQKSPELATLTAQYLIVDSRPSQAAYVLTDHLMHSDPMVQHFERWVRGRLAKGFSLEDAARSVGASERTLERRIRLILGRSPLSYVQDLRVERAVHLLRTTNKSVEAIASLVGYAGGVTLRTLLRRKLGKGVKEIRRFQ